MLHFMRRGAIGGGSTSRRVVASRSFLYMPFGLVPVESKVLLWSSGKKSIHELYIVLLIEIKEWRRG